MTLHAKPYSAVINWHSTCGRYTIFLGSQNGLSYPLNKSSLSETEQARIKKSAEEMAALKLSLALPRKNN